MCKYLLMYIFSIFILRPQVCLISLVLCIFEVYIVYKKNTYIKYRKIYKNIDHTFIKFCSVKKTSLRLFNFTPAYLLFSSFFILTGCLSRKRNSKL